MQDELRRAVDGDRIKLTSAHFERLAKAFFAEIESKFLSRVEMPHADFARQQRHQPAVFVPEEMLD